jgi:putative redox protein
MSEQGTLTLRTVADDGLRFEARFPHGTIVMDSGATATAANPVQHLLTSIAACEAMDVIGILRKKRLQVSAYEVHMSGERAEGHPRRLTAITFVHRLTGRGLQRAAVDEALRLSLEKYCSVYHSIRPDIVVTNQVEIVEG